MRLWKSKPLILSGLGGLLEFYDFIIFALFAGYLSGHFFPNHNTIISLLETFVAFSIGYLVRPIGGVIFGHFGDKYGRKKTFLISIAIMALSTLAIGLLPTYQQIGMLAPILLLTCRMLQGFSVGGEIPGAITYISELFPKQKAFATSIIFFFLINGIVLGGLVHSLLLSLLGNNAMDSWGWRVPFILGGLFGLFSYFLRKSFAESPEFEQARQTLVKTPVFEVLKHHQAGVFIGTCLVALGASLITLLFLFTPSYLNKILHIPATDFSWQLTAGMFATALITGIFGFYVDKMNPLKALSTVCFMALILAYPIFALYVDYHAIHTAVLLSILPLGLIWSIIPAVLTELFPTHIRYSGIGLSYNIGFALFGGLTPMIAYTLIDVTNWLHSPALYLIFTSLLALFAVYRQTDRKSSH